MASEKDLISDILEAETSASGFFSPIWDEAKRNKDMQRLEQWTDKEKELITEQGRIPYVLDEISHPINTLLGTQRDTRFDIHFYERNPEDAVRAEVFNATWKYFADLYDYMSVESDVFQDGVVAKYGVFGCRMDYERDYRGNLRIERIPYNELIWDTNFRQYDLTDAYWMGRMRFFRRSELKRLYPDKKELIDIAGTQTDWAGLNMTDDKHKQMWYKSEYDLVGTREFYIKDWEKKYFLWQKGQDLPNQVGFDTKKEAEAQIKLMLQQAEQYNAVLSMQMQQPRPMPEFETYDIPVLNIKKSIVVIDGVLEEEHPLEMKDYPYTVYFPYFNDGKFWSVVDRLYYPQIFKNRMISQIDHQLGVGAKGLLWIDPRTPKHEKQQIREKFGKTGGDISTKYKPELIESKGVNPQIMNLVEMAIQNIHDNMGGGNALGQKQTASESGRAVLARQAQAGLDNFIPLDNLRRTKQNLGEKIAWYLSNEITSARKLRIIGDKLSMEMMQMGNVGQVDETKPNVRYVEINTEPKNTITELEVDVIVDESAHSINKGQEILFSLTDAGKAGLITSPPPISSVIEVLNLPRSFADDWIKDAQLKQQQPPEPTTKVSINYKDLDASAKVQAQEQAGLQPNPQNVALKDTLDHPISQSVAKTVLTPKEQSMGASPK